MLKMFYQEKSIALVVVLLFLLLVLLFQAAVLTYVNNQSRIVEKRETSEESVYCSEGGVQWSKHVVSKYAGSNPDLTLLPGFDPALGGEIPDSIKRRMEERLEHRFKEGYKNDPLLNYPFDYMSDIEVWLREYKVVSGSYQTDTDFETWLRDIFAGHGWCDLVPAGSCIPGTPGNPGDPPCLPVSDIIYDSPPVVETYLVRVIAEVRESNDLYVEERWLEAVLGKRWDGVIVRTSPNRWSIYCVDEVEFTPFTYPPFPFIQIKKWREDRDQDWDTEQ